MSSSYNPKLAELVQKKAKIRAALREEFLKQVYNPHRHATGAGGFVFDPAHQRYMTMTTNRFQHFKPTVKTAAYGLGFVVIPMFMIGSFILGKRAELENQYRTGQIAYKDRYSKFL